ncbi:MAG: hypothetical protein VYE73_10355 [Acidobacteriota bacterium]|nr:hypothetical protein [Acidobacteriota bacterium]
MPLRGEIPLWNKPTDEWLDVWLTRTGDEAISSTVMAKLPAWITSPDPRAI